MNVLITGATGGIGQALIDIMIKNNYHVIAIGRNKAELKTLQNRYRHMILCYSLDLTNDEEIEYFFNFLNMRKIRIHILINGAGIGEINYFEKMSYQKMKKMLDTNVTALTKFCSYFYKNMLRKGGTIVNISSTAGFQIGGPMMGVYYATKSYVNSLTYSLYQEARDKKVNIMLLAPGPTKTKFKGIPNELSKFEKLYITTPQEVAKEFYQGLTKEKFLVIPGRINKLMHWVEKIIPDRIILAMVERVQMKKYRNLKAKKEVK